MTLSVSQQIKFVPNCSKQLYSFILPSDVTKAATVNMKKSFKNVVCIMNRRTYDTTIQISLRIFVFLRLLHLQRFIIDGIDPLNFRMTPVSYLQKSFLLIDVFEFRKIGPYYNDEKRHVSSRHHSRQKYDLLASFPLQQKTISVLFYFILFSSAR